MNFKYEFLNVLGDELYLTQTCQKLTLFHMLSLTFPVTGLFAGVVWGINTHSWLRGSAGVVGGLALGMAAAWLLPRSLWEMLRLFERKGWFVFQPRGDCPVGMLAMTKEEFLSRRRAWIRQERRQKIIGIALFVGGVVAGPYLGGLLDRTQPGNWIVILVVLTFVGFLIGCVGMVFGSNRRLRRHGLLCPACGRPLTYFEWGSELPKTDGCMHCGAEVISP